MSRPDPAMSTARVAGDLLGAGRVFCALSLVLSGAATLAMLLGDPGRPAPLVRLLLLIAVLVFGLIAVWFAFRVRFDAAIFARFARRPEEGGIAPGDFDAVIAGLRPAQSAAQDRPMEARGMEARLRGALRLLAAQIACVIAQGLSILLLAASEWLRLP